MHVGIWKGCDMRTKMYLPSTDLVEIAVSPWRGCSWFFHTTWRLISQNGDLNIYHHENVKSHRLRLFLSPNKNSSYVMQAGSTVCHHILYQLSVRWALVALFNHTETLHLPLYWQFWLWALPYTSDSFSTQNERHTRVSTILIDFQQGESRAVDKALLLYHMANLLFCSILMNVNWRNATPRRQ